MKKKRGKENKEKEESGLNFVLMELTNIEQNCTRVWKKNEKNK